MFDFIKNLFRPSLQAMNIMTINKKNILFNLGYLHSFHPNSFLFPVLKSNAYGHGIEQMTKILASYPTPYLVVDSLPEYFLAKKFTHKKFLLIGETLSQNYKEIDLKRVTIAVYTIQTLQKIIALKKKITIHIFLNTGMNREGIDSECLEDFLQLLATPQAKKYIILEGVMSHLAEADKETGSIDKQVARFKAMYAQILEQGYSIKYRHIGNSAALLGMETEFFNAWRPGLATYGYNPLSATHTHVLRGAKLKPALEVFSTVVSIHTLKTGEGTSYHFTRNATESTKIGILPFGYAEGLSIKASNHLVFFSTENASLKQSSKKSFGQIGTICMNLCSFLIGDGHIEIGDIMQILSSQPKDANTILHLAEFSDKTIYELLVSFDKGIRRKIV